jgi:hypothetical protein
MNGQDFKKKTDGQFSKIAGDPGPPIPSLPHRKHNISRVPLYVVLERKHNRIRVLWVK